MVCASDSVCACGCELDNSQQVLSDIDQNGNHSMSADKWCHGVILQSVERTGRRYRNGT